MNGAFGGGSGAIDSPYIVQDAHDFFAIANNLNACYLQDRDIDFNIPPYNEGEGCPDICPSSTTYFTGIYDGGGHKCLNYYVSKSISNNTGILNLCGRNGDITLNPTKIAVFRNCNFINMNIQYMSSSGALRILNSNGDALAHNCTFGGNFTCGAMYGFSGGSGTYLNAIGVVIYGQINCVGNGGNYRAFLSSCKASNCIAYLDFYSQNTGNEITPYYASSTAIGYYTNCVSNCSFENVLDKSKCYVIGLGDTSTKTITVNGVSTVFPNVSILYQSVIGNMERSGLSDKYTGIVAGAKQFFSEADMHNLTKYREIGFFV